MKRFLALLLICLLPMPVHGQTTASAGSVRVRITGPATYEVPGMWRFEGDRVVGKPVTGDSRFVQFTREDDGRVLTILRPGRRLTSTARGIDGDLLEFVPEGNTERIHIPLDALTKIEVSREKSSLGSSIAAGVLTGAGIFGATWLVLASHCDEGSCGNPSAWFTAVAGAAIVTGTLVARKMQGQRWQVVSAGELGVRLSGPPKSI
jgi:hypothetical protein